MVEGESINGADPKYLVSIVVLNWNGQRFIRECLEHIRNQTYAPIEIILVDNASTDGSLDIIRKEFPKARIIANAENKGFATGMNQGMTAASGEFILPLNLDAFLDSGFVENAVRAAQSEPEVGMIAAKVYALIDHQKTDTVVHVGQYLNRRIGHVNSYNVEDEEMVMGPHGCCPFFRREMLEEIQLSPGEYFDNSYFAYYEDMDLSLRAQLRGWKCLYQPACRAWHHRATSSSVHLVDKPGPLQRHAFKNRYLTIIKNFPAGLWLRHLPYLVVAELVAWPYLLLRSPAGFLNLLRAWKDVMRLLPQALAHRAAIQANRCVSTKYLAGLFQPGWKAP